MIVVRGVPVYWGIETYDPDHEGPFDYRLVCRAYMREVLPPYRESTRALRIRVSHRHWLHVGLFKYNREPKRYAMTAPPAEIGQWGLDAAEDEDDVTEDWADAIHEGWGDFPVVPDGDERPGDDAGDDAGLHERGVPWPAPWAGDRAVLDD